MTDEAAKWTDEQVAALERRIIRMYGEASAELTKTVKAYFEQFAKRDAAMQKELESGKITKRQYKNWRLAQIARGQRFAELRDTVAQRVVDADEIAAAYINETTPRVYNTNRNYSVYSIERLGYGAVDFTLYDEQTVKRLVVEQPDVMPYYPKERAVQRGFDLAYGKRQITSQVTSSILQGQSIGHMADDLMQRIDTMTRTSAVRASRTAMTAAQNSGRQAGYKAAADSGIAVKKRWIATKDMRTRHDHGAADGQVVNWDEAFSVGGEPLMYPGDPSGSAGNIYNCRCSMRAEPPDGIEQEPRMMRVYDPVTDENVLVEAMTYSDWEEWVKERQERANGSQ